MQNKPTAKFPSREMLMIYNSTNNAGKYLLQMEGSESLRVRRQRVVVDKP